MKSNLEIMAEILPSIRAEIAKELVSAYKLNQSEVSRMLGVSQPAISQYVRELRGNNGKISHSGVQSEIKMLCEKLASGKLNWNELESELYNICKLTIKQ